MSQELSKNHQSQDYHTPVMMSEVVEMFRPVQNGVIVDATYGGGGHTMALLENLDETIRILGIDRDPEAVNRAVRHPRLQVEEGNFGQMEQIAQHNHIDQAAGVLFDLGVSRHQLDSGYRGFSYRHDGPLDMRMGPDCSTTAHHLVNQTPVPQLAGILKRFGEEKFAHRIASFIDRARPIETTAQLSEVITRAVPAGARRGRRGHPARRTFQALRMAVNEEMSALEAGLEQGLTVLRPGGRCVVISYHSLEDRLVKRRFRQGEKGEEGPVLPVAPPAELFSLTRKVLRPSPAEVNANPSARSARLRAVEKVA